MSFHRLGRIYADLEHFEESVDSHLSGLDILESPRGLSSTAFAYSEIDDIPRATEHARRAFDQYSDTLSKKRVVSASWSNDYVGTFLLLCRLYRTSGEAENAINAHQRFLSVNDEIFPRSEVTKDGLIILARRYLASTEFMERHEQKELALLYYHRALALLEKTDVPNENSRFSEREILKKHLIRLIDFREKWNPSSLFAEIYSRRSMRLRASYL